MSNRIKTAIGALTASLLGAAAALAAPMALDDGPAARAAGVCSPAVETAIKAATGEDTGQGSGAGLACNPFLYTSNGHWSSQTELNNAVLGVMNRCGNDANSRRLVLALLERTGIAPADWNPEDQICHERIYEEWVDATNTGGPADVRWDRYIDPGGTQFRSVWEAVNGTMSVCHRSDVSFAVTSVTDNYPRTDPSPAVEPNLHYPSATGLRGQCDPGLYRNGTWSSYDDLRSRVEQRVLSQENCASTDPAIDQAYRDLTGWRPLASECNPERYRTGAGLWSSNQDLVNRIYHSNRCSQPELGVVYAFDVGRRIRGSGWATGECNPFLYTEYIFTSFSDLRQKVLATNGILVDDDVEIDATGDVTVGGGPEIDASRVLVGSQTGAPRAANLAGTVWKASGDQPVKVISTGGGNVISTGGGNVISTGGGNVISTGGGNVQATSSLISDKGLG